MAKTSMVLIFVLSSLTLLLSEVKSFHVERRFKESNSGKIAPYPYKLGLAQQKNENFPAEKFGFRFRTTSPRVITRQINAENMVPPSSLINEKDTGSMVPSQKHGLTTRKGENFPEDNFGFGIQVPQIPPSRYRQIIDRILLGENTEKELQGDEEFEGKYFWNDQPFDKVESSFGEPEVMNRDFGNFDGFDEEQNISID